ncbi:MAG TPA: superoxide dismutase [Polyangia bacterium]|jgi:Fe-Mn family superoxide dismutase|nr:superoxide dismutase [Polyangia bacterium]
MSKYTLPELAYDYAALEPHVSGKIMELHHDKHHAAYVAGANTAAEGLAEARSKNDFAKIAALEKALAFHTSGHVLHSLFWQNLAPKAGGEPTGALGTQITQDFGGFTQFRAQLTNAAMTLMGSGWAALVWEPLAKRLVTTQIYDHQSNVNQGGVPLLVLDAWEHAFYLQYGPDKKSFFEAVWSIWNWVDVGQRFDKVRNLDLGLRGAVDAK